MNVLSSLGWIVHRWMGFLCLWSLLSLHADPGKQIRIMLYEFHPYVGVELKDDGFTADVVLTAFRRAGYQVQYEFFPWRRCFENLDNGSWDLLINLYYTEERAQTYAYPRHHIALSEYTFFALKSRKDIRDGLTIHDLEKLQIGVVQKASYGKTLDAILPTLPRVYSGNLRERYLMQMLLAGRIDIMPCDAVSGWYIFQQVLDKADHVRTVQSAFFESQKLYPVVLKTNPAAGQILSDWDKEMEKMLSDGSLMRIYRKHSVAFPRQSWSF